MEYFSKLDPSQIWHIKQNKPTLIVHDLQKYGVPAAVSYSILLGRGVFKWFAVRRDLIWLKNVWKGRVTAIIESIREAKRNQDYEQVAFLRGYLQAYEETRAEVRTLCHSPRFRAPDFDKGAQKFLDSIRGGEMDWEIYFENPTSQFDKVVSEEKTIIQADTERDARAFIQTNLLGQFGHITEVRTIERLSATGPTYPPRNCRTI